MNRIELGRMHQMIRNTMPVKKNNLIQEFEQHACADDRFCYSNKDKNTSSLKQFSLQASLNNINNKIENSAAAASNSLVDLKNKTAADLNDVEEQLNDNTNTTKNAIRSAIENVLSELNVITENAKTKFESVTNNLNSSTNTTINNIQTFATAQLGKITDTSNEIVQTIENKKDEINEMTTNSLNTSKLNVQNATNTCLTHLNKIQTTFNAINMSGLSSLENKLNEHVKENEKVVNDELFQLNNVLTMRNDSYFESVKNFLNEFYLYLKNKFDVFITKLSSKTEITHTNSDSFVFYLKKSLVVSPVSLSFLFLFVFLIFVLNY